MLLVCCVTGFGWVQRVGGWRVSCCCGVAGLLRDRFGFNVLFKHMMQSAERVFSLSMTVSGLRCFIAYVLFPWMLPVVRVAGWVGISFGLVLGVVAIVFNVLSIRRFWRVNHKHKKLITTVNVCVIILVVLLLIFDILKIARGLS